MKTETLHVGMKVRHPQAGIGIVRSVAEQVAEIRFEDGTRRISPETSDLQPAEAQAGLVGLELPLHELIAQTVESVLDRLGVEMPEATVAELGSRWQKGRMVLHPADPTLQTKEIDLETFFHKIVMLRNNLRVLEQKLNAHAGLSEAEKVDAQQYITRCYGSLTSFNLLFRDKQDQFSGSAGS